MKKKINFGMIVCTLVLVLLLPGVSLYQNYLKDKEGPNSTLLVEREYHNRYAKRDAYLKSFGKIMNKNASNPMQMDQILIDSNMPAEELASVLSKGIYGKVDLTTSLASLQNRADLVFFKNILLGNYEEAFRIDPNKLSDSSSVLMAEYANHLYKMKKYDELVNFDNAMLQNSKIYEYVSTDGLKQNSDLTYRDIYLRKIIEGSKIIQNRSLFTLVAYDLEKPSYEEMEDSYNNEWFMVNFWCMQEFDIEKLRTKGFFGNDYGTKIVDVEMDRLQNYAEFDLEHYDSYTMEISKKGETIFNTSCDDSSDDKSKSIYVAKVIKFLGAGIVDYIVEKNYIEKKIKDLNTNYKLEDFGSCGSNFQEEINKGFYHPKKVRFMYQFQENGLPSMAGWSEEEVLELENKIESDNFESLETKNVAKQILENNYNIFEEFYINENGEKIQCTFFDFIRAISFFEKNTSDFDFYELKKGDW